jgi:hypothetical protein
MDCRSLRVKYELRGNGFHIKVVYFIDLIDKKISSVCIA